MLSEDEIVEMHLKNGLKNGNRTSNAFLIYRKNYALQNPKLSRNDVSKLASESWKSVSNEIKDHYKRMAENVKKEFKKRVNSLCFIHCNLAGTNDNETNPPMLTSSSTTCHNPFLGQTSSGTFTYINPSPSNFPINIYSSHQIVNTNPDIIYLNPPIDQNFLDTTDANFPPSNPIYSSYQFVNMNPPIDQNFLGNISDTTYYNPQFINMDQNFLDTTDVNFPPSNPIYSSHQFVNMNQNSPDITCLFPPIDQNFLGITCPDSLNINKNTSDTTFYNPTFINMNENPLCDNYFNSRLSNMNQNPLDTNYSDHLILDIDQNDHL
ncbi:3712_t:CDS:1 [Diversispora eburnea]|uniref:3712_t:CDS:1 n=1 Tax=Diversispora eburnea TaxID=1213867 RepID=A0A9N8WNX0_9GLOM|nr:3712_t:CDS:1 [Diversispora eburnea]